MQINMTTDYALRVLLKLAESKSVCSTKEIAAAIGVTQPYVQKIMRTLSGSDFVRTYQGSSGGFKLNINPYMISMLDVIKLMEPTFKINRCLEDDHYCNLDRTAYCKMHKVYTEIQKEIEDKLSAMSIGDLAFDNLD